MVIELRGMFLNFDYSLKMNKIFQKPKKNNRCIEECSEGFFTVVTRVGLVRDSEEEIIKIMDGLKLSIKKMCSKKIQILEKDIQLSLKYEK